LKLTLAFFYAIPAKAFNQSKCEKYSAIGQTKIIKIVQKQGYPFYVNVMKVIRKNDERHFFKLVAIGAL
jgi:hypothetical protein